MLQVVDRNGKSFPCRALIDTCSTSNFITNSIATRLQLPKKECAISIGTLNTLTTVSTAITTAVIQLTDHPYERKLEFLPVLQISQLTPDQLINRAAINIPRNIRLADPQFHRPTPVDMLLGSGVALSLLCIGQMNIATTQDADLYLQKTRLGWVIGGSASASESSRIHTCHSTNTAFDLNKFWEIEEVPTTSSSRLTAEEIACEEHFKRNVTRTSSGRFVVALPFNNRVTERGEFKSRALNRLKGIERRLFKDVELRKAYEANLREYIDPRHMSKVPEEEGQDGCYSPHHAVLKKSSLTTKVRVVFDGSAATSTGVSVNNTLHVGPKIHTFVLTADIEKMYRQFLIRPADRKHQRILWRDETNKVCTYELDTVTFGLAPAPFLAVRCLHQLAKEEEQQFPRAAQTLIHDTYVDDTLMGANTLNEARELRDEFTELLRSGELYVRQWASNHHYRFSSFKKLKAIIAYCLRLLPLNRQQGVLTINERRRAHNIIIKMVQSQQFGNELQSLKKNHALNAQSRLLPLKPFIDPEGLMRVGGRLQHFQLPFSQRHPIILPKGHHITQLLIEREHYSQFHSGIHATLYSIRRTYWPVDGRNQVRKGIRAHVTCSRHNPISIVYMIGNLPADRVTQARPFSREGVDYCGPFFITEKKHRNRIRVKMYVAIFVCLTVKVMHIEVVSDLTTEPFIAALKRFTARRGICSDIYSDNGTNFVGANNKMQEIKELLCSTSHEKTIQQLTAGHGIKWHFILARAPNFSGLWEAAVKSFKHHLKRVMGSVLFTFEQFNIIIIEIEAILNSRPLTPLSSDPNLLVLTPGHFLVGDTLTSLPDPDVRHITTNRLSAWQYVQQLRQHFWARWHRQYINELTTHHKWTKSIPPITVGILVLLKEDNLHPLQWAIGRVLNVHPGPDGVIRVVTIKTAHNTVERSVRKVAPLPVITNTGTNDASTEKGHLTLEREQDDFPNEE